MFGVGHTEIMIIALLLGVLIFGRRIPEVARSVGSSIASFKRGLREMDIRRYITDADDEKTKTV